MSDILEIFLWDIFFMLMCFRTSKLLYIALHMNKLNGVAIETVDGARGTIIGCEMSQFN